MCFVFKTQTFISVNLSFGFNLVISECVPDPISYVDFLLCRSNVIGMEAVQLKVSCGFSPK